MKLSDLQPGTVYVVRPWARDSAAARHGGWCLAATDDPIQTRQREVRTKAYHRATRRVTEVHLRPMDDALAKEAGYYVWLDDEWRTGLSIGHPVCTVAEFPEWAAKAAEDREAARQEQEAARGNRARTLKAIDEIVGRSTYGQLHDGDLERIVALVEAADAMAEVVDSYVDAIHACAAGPECAETLDSLADAYLTLRKPPVSNLRAGLQRMMEADS